MKYRVWITMVTLLVAAESAQAARWRIDGAAGIFIPAGEVEADGRSTDVDVGGSFAAGGGFGIGDYVDLTAHFQTNISDLEHEADLLEVYSFTAGGRAYFMPPGRFRPWAICEIGWYRARADSIFDDDITDDTFGLNIGGGFDIFIHKIVSLGGDIRYHNAFDALDGLDFVTVMFNVGVHLGK